LVVSPITSRPPYEVRSLASPWRNIVWSSARSTLVGRSSTGYPVSALGGEISEAMQPLHSMRPLHSDPSTGSRWVLVSLTLTCATRFGALRSKAAAARERAHPRRGRDRLRSVGRPQLQQHATRRLGGASDRAYHLASQATRASSARLPAGGLSASQQEAEMLKART
jgi:hypothetical protein